MNFYNRVPHKYSHAGRYNSCVEEGRVGEVCIEVLVDNNFGEEQEMEGRYSDYNTSFYTHTLMVASVVVNMGVEDAANKLVMVVNTVGCYMFCMLDRYLDDR